MAYLGKTPSQAVRSRYYFTATGGETSLSGADDNANTLTFTDGNYVDVALNGVTLVAGTDYNTTTANTIGGLTALVASDVVEVIVYDTFSVFSGNVNGDFTVGGTVTGGSVAVDNITIDGTEIDLSSGDLTVDVAGDINLDAGGGEIYFQDDGATIAYFSNSSSDLLLGVNTSDKDLYIQGNDGGSTINALHLDMSAAGYATFNAGGSFSGNVGIGVTPEAKLHISTGGGITPFASSQIVSESTGNNYIELNGGSTSTTAVYFGDSSDQDAGGILYNHSNDSLSLRANAGSRMLIDSSGNVGIGSASPTAGFRASINGDGSSIVGGVEFRNNPAGGSTFTIGHASATSPSATLNVVDAANLSFNTHNTERLRITSTGKINLSNRDFGFVNQNTTVSLADDASIVINAGTAGGGLLAIYDTASGNHALYRVGYSSATNTDILSQGGAGATAYSVTDTDGKICVIGSNHTITIKNRLGATKSFYINMFMAGNNFVG